MYKCHIAEILSGNYNKGDDGGCGEWQAGKASRAAIGMEEKDENL